MTGRDGGARAARTTAARRSRAVLASVRSSRAFGFAVRVVLLLAAFHLLEGIAAVPGRPPAFGLVPGTPSAVSPRTCRSLFANAPEREWTEAWMGRTAAEASASEPIPLPSGAARARASCGMWRNVYVQVR